MLELVFLPSCQTTLAETQRPFPLVLVHDFWLAPRVCGGQQHLDTRWCSPSSCGFLTGGISAGGRCSSCSLPPFCLLTSSGSQLRHRHSWAAVMPAPVQWESQPGESILFSKVVLSLCSAVLLFMRNVCLAIRMTQICFSFIFCHRPWFLAHRSQRSWNFQSDKSIEASFVIIVGLLSSVPENASFTTVKVKWETYYSSQAPFHHNRLMLIRRPLEST